MKIIKTEYLIKAGSFPKSQAWETIYREIQKAIKAITWPRGSKSFTIYPESGKKRGKGNGVKPLKDAFCFSLSKKGWNLETRLPIGVRKYPGPIDATKQLGENQFFAVEWETGNISSSHRALNKMALGIKNGMLKGGTLVLPTRGLYKYLTDRVGNIDEIEPYFELWSSMPFKDGILAVISVEHDATSLEVPRIKKGTDGRALI
ncbi:MAG TPA: hypothetical protein VGB26_12260 [Nitrospiria bacterium]|jgi:hypothetical protein